QAAVQRVDRVILALVRGNRPRLREFFQVERNGGGGEPQPLGEALDIQILARQRFENLQAGFVCQTFEKLQRLCFRHGCSSQSAASAARISPAASSFTRSTRARSVSSCRSARCRAVSQEVG